MSNRHFLFIVFSIFVFWGCQNNSKLKIVTLSGFEKVSKEKNTEKSYAKLSIDGMFCAIGCAASIEKKLKNTAGVSSVTVNFDSKIAWVIYDAQILTLNGISEVVKKTSDIYSVKTIEQLKSFPF